MARTNPAQENYVLSDLHKFASRPESLEMASDIESFVRQNSVLVSTFNQAACFFFIIDFSKMKYLYVSNGIRNIMGYTAEEWMSEGINAAFRTLHPDDRLRLKKVHDEQFAFLFSQPVEKRREFHFATTFRVIRKDGQVIWLLTQDSFIALDEKGKPSIALEVVSEITNVKENNIMTFSIMHSGNHGLKTERKYYYPEGTDVSFTNKEIQILQLLAAGKSTRDIAAELCLSDLTVYTHRRNMLKKAGTRNLNGLLSFASRNGLL